VIAVVAQLESCDVHVALHINGVQCGHIRMDVKTRMPNTGIRVRNDNAMVGICRRHIGVNIHVGPGAAADGHESVRPIIMARRRTVIAAIRGGVRRRWIAARTRMGRRRMRPTLTCAATWVSSAAIIGMRSHGNAPFLMTSLRKN
jgi:hypothetical protein